MAQLPKNFIGIDALQHVAEQVSKEIWMGPGYTDPSEMDRLGIDIVSGLQFKRTFHIFLRKGGTTRRKDVHRQLNSEIGFLKERTMTVKLAWDHFEGNADDFCETVFGTDAQGSYPLATQATEAILKSYADNLAACLWFGDIDLDNGDESIPAHEQGLALYDGFHTCIKHDLEDGIISIANKNLIPCGVIEAPSSTDDTTPYDTFVEWVMNWDPRLRKQNVRVYMSEFTAKYIAAGYANSFHGNEKVSYEIGDNYKLPGLSRVTICPVADFGEGDRMYATIDKNFVYGVDTLSNETYVGVRVGSDVDMRSVQWQCQSIQGAGLRNPYSYAFCMSDGALADPIINRGDYENSDLTVVINEPEGAGNVVKVDEEPYTKPIAAAPNQIFTLKAEPAEGYEFSHWSTGKKTAEIQLTSEGMSIGVIAFFKAKP